MLNCDFEVVSRFADADLNLPERKTEYSAGYDLIAAEDVIIPSMFNMVDEVMENLAFEIKPNEYLTLETMAELTKQADYRPTLVSTGMKCKIPDGYYLELSVRSSTPLKHWIILANGVGIIDADYYNNSSNEGEIFLQMINLSPFNIQIKKGEAIGQGILKPYFTVEHDVHGGERVGGFGSTTK